MTRSGRRHSAARGGCLCKYVGGNGSANKIVNPMLVASTHEKHREAPMTISQAAALQVRWKQKQRVERVPCSHTLLEMEWNEQGHPKGNYICIVCGEPLIHLSQYVSPFDSVSEGPL
jgi:hypothetical protein